MSGCQSTDLDSENCIFVMLHMKRKDDCWVAAVVANFRLGTIIGNIVEIYERLLKNKFLNTYHLFF